ncbi:glycosyltransferase [Polynucleobacter sp. HIN9]|uniref:glycosyltransferase n=1 Tax=Polynucleobacter sp. HIN9 TaxID=3047868 RepID=UPI002572E77E|nr:glycosyltransferase [Polynucleobacter sp. HIN9]BEI40373.1 glycosyltransferase [Polynucleobacter sp. HIN9]
MVRFSIIIPVKAINDYVRETVPYVQSLDGNNWELLILPNEADQDEWCDNRIKLIPSGQVGPAAKRDLGAEHAAGEILVFLDDDSYPSSNLLSVATPYFGDESIVAIGGPAITPPADSFWQKVSGAVFLSKFSGGNPERYISVGAPKEVEDWPSVNLMVRRKEFLQIGGFDSPYWPGEDTKLCLDLVNKTNKKIMYVPNLMVWHHRRSGLIGHLKQIGAYGLHRGYFAKVHPETSRKITYFIPSAFVFFIVVSCVMSTLPPIIQQVIFAGWAIYGLALMKALYDIKKNESIWVGLVALPYIFFTHIWYGIRFIQGMFSKKLISKLR